MITNSVDSPHNPVHIKIADYGISRISLPTGTKGFGGTEGFMAPEIICHNGEEEYTEKVISIDLAIIFRLTHLVINDLFSFRLIVFHLEC